MHREIDVIEIAPEAVCWMGNDRPDRLLCRLGPQEYSCLLADLYTLD